MNCEYIPDLNTYFNEDVGSFVTGWMFDLSTRHVLMELMMGKICATCDKVNITLLSLRRYKFSVCVCACRGGLCRGAAGDPDDEGLQTLQHRSLLWQLHPVTDTMTTASGPQDSRQIRSTDAVCLCVCVCVCVAGRPCGSVWSSVEEDHCRTSITVRHAFILAVSIFPVS